MDYRFQSVYDRLRNLENGLVIFSTTFNYDSNGDVESIEYENDLSEDILIEYFYNTSGDVSYSTGKVDAVLQYTQTFNYNANGDITSTTVT